MSHREQQHPATDKPHHEKSNEVRTTRTEHSTPSDRHEKHASEGHASEGHDSEVRDSEVRDSSPDISHSDTLPVGAFQGRLQGTDDTHGFDGGSGDPDFTAGSGIQEVESLSHHDQGSGNDAMIDFGDGNSVSLVGVNAEHLSDTGLDWS